MSGSLIDLSFSSFANGHFLESSHLYKIALFQGIHSFVWHSELSVVLTETLGGPNKHLQISLWTGHQLRWHREDSQTSLLITVCCDGELAPEAYTWHVSRIWWWSRLISSLKIGNLALLTNNNSTFTEGIPVEQLIWVCCIILIGLVNLLDYCFLMKQVACHFMNSCPNYCTDSLFVPHILISPILSETVFNF